MKINWLNETPLTYEEAIELLNRSHKKRLDMELKNNWDAYVNDFTFWEFLNDTYNYMLDEIRKEVDIESKYFYPKIKDVIDWAIFVDGLDSRLAKDVLKQEGKENIWEIVEDWWKALFKMIY